MVVVVVGGGGGGGMRPNTATSRSFACFCFYDLVNYIVVRDIRSEADLPG